MNVSLSVSDVTFLSKSFGSPAPPALPHADSFVVLVLWLPQVCGVASRERGREGCTGTAAGRMPQRRLRSPRCARSRVRTANSGYEIPISRHALDVASTELCCATCTKPCLQAVALLALTSGIEQIRRCFSPWLPPDPLHIADYHVDRAL